MNPIRKLVLLKRVLDLWGKAERQMKMTRGRVRFIGALELVVQALNLIEDFWPAEYKPVVLAVGRSLGMLAADLASTHNPDGTKATEAYRPPTAPSQDPPRTLGKF